MAIGTSLATVIFTSLLATYSHSKRKTILWKVFGIMTPGAIFGAILGAYLGILFAPKFLEILFGILACSLGVYFFLPTIFLQEKSTIPLPSFWIMNLLSLCLSGFSSMLGLGGGVLFMPLFILLLHIPTRQSIGTSSAMTCIISFFGAVVFLLPNISHPLYPYSLGYLYLPSFLPMTLGSIVGAPLGVKLTDILPISTLKKCFGILIALAGILLMVR